ARVPGRVDRRAGRFGSDLGAGPRSEPTLAASADADVQQMGVRPEDLRLTSPDAEGVLRGEVYVVAPMGHETIIEVRAGDVHLVVLSPRDSRVAFGESGGVGVDDRTARLFDGRGRTRFLRGA